MPPAPKVRVEILLVKAVFAVVRVSSFLVAAAERIANSGL